MKKTLKLFLVISLFLLTNKVNALELECDDYVNHHGIEHPQMVKEEQLQRAIELANKRNYVENNIHKYEIGKEISKQKKTLDDVLYTKEEIHQYMRMHEAPVPLNLETMFEANETTKGQTDNLYQEKSGPVLTKKLTPPKHTENK